MASGDRYSFFETVWNDSLAHTQKGMIREDMVELLKTDKDIIYTIPMEHEYRPDLIAEKFFGNPKLYWVLVYINNFSNCPEDFSANTSIRIPRYERIMELL
jgi:hypothetical protein